MFDRRRIARIAAALAFFGTALSASPALAQRNCTAQLVTCFDRAAQQSTAIGRAAAGLDCALEFAGCARKTVVGV